MLVVVLQSCLQELLELMTQRDIIFKNLEKVIIFVLKIIIFKLKS